MLVLTGGFNCPSSDCAAAAVIARLVTDATVLDEAISYSVRIMRIGRGVVLTN